jgi:putative endonuclease
MLSPSQSVSASTALKHHRQADRRQVGAHWELQAQQWLQARGLLPLARQWQDRRGEIDLIMSTGAVAVIVEVRQRSGNTHGGAACSIDARKRRRIIRTALHWWLVCGQHRFSSLRFDTVTFDAQSGPQWLPNAFDAEGSV